MRIAKAAGAFGVPVAAICLAAAGIARSALRRASRLATWRTLPGLAWLSGLLPLSTLLARLALRPRLSALLAARLLPAAVG